MVTINVAALNPASAEAELFGHVDGGNNGAMPGRAGLLLQANGGTLFLDEVAEIPLPLQTKLLRVLDHGEVLPVGSDAPLRSRFRVISATNQNLRKKVEAGEFRHDLYFRLCTFEIDLPPLRNRPDDISLLAHHFASQFGSESAALAEETIEELQRRPWYGNVRELRTAIEHALVLARRGVVMPEHLPSPLPNLWQTEGGTPAMQEEELADALARIARDLAADPEIAGTVYDRFLQQVEPPLLTAVMDSCGKRFAPAARVLGLHRTTLKKKLTQYEMEDVATDG
jgi:two-component system nitrogen regulation response regulator GlnG